jgi:hypothetical protein
MSATEPTPERTWQHTGLDPLSADNEPQPQTTLPYQDGPEKPPPVQVNALASLALNLALLGTGIFAVIVGHKALKELNEWETRWPAQKGKTQAIIALILGYLQTILWTIFWIMLIVGVSIGFEPASDTRLAELHSECAAGNDYSCDELYVESEAGSAEERFGDTCGGRQPAGNWCSPRGEEEFG